MENHDVIALQNPQADALSLVLRDGAQRLLAQAIEAEVEDPLDRHAERRTEDGRTGVVRNGHHPERDIQTGLGPVRVRIPMVRAKGGIRWFSARVWCRRTCARPGPWKLRCRGCI